MSSPARYFDLIRERKDAYNHRLRLVAPARQHGIKATARFFQTTVPTVRKWLRRYQQQGPSGLLERSRAHHHCPHQTPLELERQVVQLRRQLPTFGATRLKWEFPLSHKENLSPWQIIERLAPRSPLELCLLPPINLDYFLNPQGGYDEPFLFQFLSALDTRGEFANMDGKLHFKLLNTNPVYDVVVDAQSAKSRAAAERNAGKPLLVEGIIRTSQSNTPPPLPLRDFPPASW